MTDRINLDRVLKRAHKILVDTFEPNIENGIAYGKCRLCWGGTRHERKCLISEIRAIIRRGKIRQGETNGRQS